MRHEVCHPAGTARLAAERDAGFGSLKIGWLPFGADTENDCAYLDAARARLERFAPYRLGWVEEPLDRDDLPGQAALRPDPAVLRRLEVI